MLGTIILTGEYANLHDHNQNESSTHHGDGVDFSGSGAPLLEKMVSGFSALRIDNGSFCDGA